MKNQFLLAGLLVILYSASFAQQDYRQFEVIYITPKLDKVDLFRKALAAHNKKFHATAPYKVGVSSILTGPNSGGYAWVMGPTTWTQLDGAPGEGEHMTDWEKNINPLCESIGEMAYWRDVKDARYDAEGSAAFKKSSMRANYVRPGEMDRYLEQMKKIAEMFRKKKYAASFSVATRVGPSAGINAVSFISFANWSYLDNNNSWNKDFDEVHGAGAWARFLEEIDICVDTSKTYGELSENVPELGG